MLVDSLICRLCGEENINGTSLFNRDENEPDLSTTVNRYLPLKVNIFPSTTFHNGIQLDFLCTRVLKSN